MQVGDVLRVPLNIVNLNSFNVTVQIQAINRNSALNISIPVGNIAINASRTATRVVNITGFSIT
jgi:hypothetical protein